VESTTTTKPALPQDEEVQHEKHRNDKDYKHTQVAAPSCLNHGIKLLHGISQ
jgi:hypothetical protein